MKTSLISGCWDAPSSHFLHEGHIYILNEAKKISDYLIVALNSDLYIQRHKRPTPMADELTRYCRLLDTGLVNECIIFDEDTPTELIKLLKPDILILGYEKRDYAIPWEEEVKEWGVEIKIMPKLEGYSSTKIYESLGSATGQG